MWKKLAWLITCGLPLCLLAACPAGNSSPELPAASPQPSAGSSTAAVTLSLPAPRLTGSFSLEQALSQRRSIREYRDEALTLAELAQVLWAGQGQTADWGGRTAPSAGGLYALDLYVVAGDVADLEPGLYRYLPAEHQLLALQSGDLRTSLSEAALSQAWVAEAPIDLLIGAVYSRITAKYGQRGERYAQMEAGHAAQNICLEATALGLGTVTVGAFEDDRVRQVCGLAVDLTPLYLLPLGRPR